MKTSCWTILFAWVLWTHSEGAKLDSWSQTSGFASEKQCNENIEEKLETWSRFKDAKFNGASVTFSETKTTLTYQCLADDEDPRKKKLPKPVKAK